MRGLSGASAELFGQRATLLHAICQLPFSEHLHQLNAVFVLAWWCAAGRAPVSMSS